ncbi:MAG: hypothetical protein CM15mP57_4500 [Alphaproteobacteria bacterium]|nr:MAG: hypothetical protein CM15mP57_4500 [Alphaproteobacteria bacterium]
MLFPWLWTPPLLLFGGPKKILLGPKYKDDIEGIACFAFTNEIPATIKEMDLMSVEEDQATIPIAYTLWSFKKGAGKKIMKELQKYIKSKEQFESIITISPLTPVATHYHIRNGARLNLKLTQKPQKTFLI